MIPFTGYLSISPSSLIVFPGETKTATITSPGGTLSLYNAPTWVSLSGNTLIVSPTSVVSFGTYTLEVTSAGTTNSGDYQTATTGVTVTVFAPS